MTHYPHVLRVCCAEASAAVLTITEVRPTRVTIHPMFDFQ